MSGHRVSAFAQHMNTAAHPGSPMRSSMGLVTVIVIGTGTLDRSIYRIHFHQSVSTTPPTMILISRPSDVPTPSPILTLGEDIAALLQRPYEDNPAAGDDPSVMISGPSNPETRDRLLAYAYVVYDTSVTRQLPPQSIPSGHASLLLPLLELLHGLYPYNTPISLLLGCVYYHHDLVQRGLWINGHILQYEPGNVRSYSLLYVSWIRSSRYRSRRCATWG